MIPNGATIGGKHTYSYFNMIPKSKITFNPPAPKTNYVDVPGSDGELDYSEVLTGSVTYSNRKGTLEFLVLGGSTAYTTVYSQLLDFFHGKELRCVLDDDPLFFYQGRFSVNQWKSMEGISTIAIDYNLNPYKYTLSSTADLDWLWDSPLNTIIYYGTFDVSGSKARNLINPSSVSLVPTFTCSEAMSVTIGGTSYNLPKGTTTTPGFSLAPGNNNMTFTGNGRVLVDYSAGKQL